MANWVSATDTSAGRAGFVNLDQMWRVQITGGGSAWTLTAVDPNEGSTNYTLAGSPFDSEADAIAAFEAATTPTGGTADFSGTVTLPG